MGLDDLSPYSIVCGQQQQTNLGWHEEFATALQTLACSKEEGLPNVSRSIWTNGNTPFEVR
eukprot:12925999-Prorocentrum_lima.AAC.1